MPKSNKKLATVLSSLADYVGASTDDLRLALDELDSPEVEDKPKVKAAKAPAKKAAPKKKAPAKAAKAPEVLTVLEEDELLEFAGAVMGDDDKAQALFEKGGASAIHKMIVKETADEDLDELVEGFFAEEDEDDVEEDEDDEDFDDEEDEDDDEDLDDDEEDEDDLEDDDEDDLDDDDDDWDDFDD